MRENAERKRVAREGSGDVDSVELQRQKRRFSTRMQAPDGEWMLTVKDKLRAQNRPSEYYDKDGKRVDGKSLRAEKVRPGHDEMYRVLAVCELWSTGYGRRLVMFPKTGKPATFQQIASAAKVGMNNIRRALKNADDRGLVRVTGKFKGKAHVYTYAHPRRSKLVKVLEVKQEEIVLNPENNGLLTSCDSNNLQLFTFMRKCFFQPSLMEGFVKNTGLTEQIVLGNECLRTSIATAVEKAWELLTREVQAVLRSESTYKEERKVERNTTTTAAAKTASGAPPPLSVAAAAGSSSTSSRKPEPFRYPVTLTKGRGIFPTVDEAFVLIALMIARQERPMITDEELASCLVKKHGQKSEGLWLGLPPEYKGTLRPRVQALNEYDTQQAADRQNAADASARIAEENRRLDEYTATPEYRAERVQRAREHLRTSKWLSKKQKQEILLDYPELTNEFAGAAK